MKKRLSYLVTTVSIFGYNVAFAANKLEGIINENTGDTNIKSFLSRIGDIILSAAGALALLFIIIGGFQMVTSAGNPEKVKTAKKTLTYAIIGLLAVALSKVAFGVITGTLGKIFFT